MGDPSILGFRKGFRFGVLAKHAGGLAWVWLWPNFPQMDFIIIQQSSGCSQNQWDNI